MTNRSKSTIRRRILISFVLLLVIPVIILSGLNIAGILILSRDNAQDSGEALRLEELNNLQRIANDTSLFIEETFQKVSDEATTLADYTSDLFNGRINAAPRPYYYWDASKYPSIPGLYYDPFYGIDVSFEVSCYYVPPTTMNSSYDDLSPGAVEILETSSNIDTAFKMLHEANPNYIWFSAGFETGGIYKNYPYNDIGFFYDEGYDPRERPWYTDAVGEGKVVFTSPYLDPTSGLMISVAREIRYDSGELIGVISMDLTIDTIRTAIMNIDVLEEGYAFLIDDQGKTISHPDIPEPIPSDYEAEDIEEMVFDVGDSSNRGAFRTAIQLMKDGEYGQATFMKNNGQEKWFIVFAPIAITGYSMGIIVPEEDLIAPANAVKDQIQTLSIWETVIFAVVLAIIIALIVVFASIISRRIVRPIKDLTKMVEYITEGDLSREMKSEAAAQTKEIGILHSAFQNLVTTLRFGNTDYYRGDLNRAFDNYTRALELFKTTNNQRGVAICYNNLGNIYRAWGDFKKAQESYQEAIAIGEEMDDWEGLASRYNNLGLFYMETGQMADAKNALETALEYDERMDNQTGMAIRLGNLGLYYSKAGDRKKAKEYYTKAIELCERTDNKSGLAQSHLKMGSFLKEAGEYKEAQRHLEKSLKLAKEIEDIRLLANCFEQLATVYDMQNMTAKSHQAEAKAAEIRQSLITKKVVLFVIDYSGSMSGSRIKAAVQGAEKILETQVNPQDDVAIIIFNESSHILQPLTNVENNYDRIKNSLRKLKYPQYRTAFYDALGDALKQLHEVKGNEQKWVIALSDGLDNTSERFTIGATEKKGLFKQKTGRKSIEEYIRETMLNANLIIVGIGEELAAVEDQLEKLCTDTPRGKYISIESGRAVDKAIEEAFYHVKDLLAEVEIEGFTVDQY